MAKQTATTKPKKCGSCGADGHCRASYKGCINNGKPKDQWKRVDGAPPVAVAGTPSVTANAPGASAPNAQPKQCSSCGADGHCRVSYKGCINYGKPKDQWKRVEGAPPVAGPPPVTTNATGESAPDAQQKQPEKSKKKKKETWFKSEGKLLLRNSIIAGTVTRASNPSTVHKSNPEWEKWPFENFKTNLKNLIDAVALDYARMSKDCEAYGHDLALLKEVRQNDPNPPPTPWHMSAAKPLLIIDIDAKKHEKMTPMALWMTKIEYMEFPLGVFRDHIYQELNARDKKDSRYLKKKKRLPPPPRCGEIDSVALDLIYGQDNEESASKQNTKSSKKE